MAGTFLRKTVTLSFIILKWLLRISFAVLKMGFRMAELFLLMFVMAVSGISTVLGVTSGRQ